MNKHGSVRLIVFSIWGDIVFQHEDENNIQFLGKGDDGNYLSNGTYMWHSRIKYPEHWLEEGSIVQTTLEGHDDSVKIDTGLLFVSRAEGRIHFVGMGSPVVSPFSIAETADNIGENRALISVSLREA